RARWRRGEGLGRHARGRLEVPGRDALREQLLRRGQRPQRGQLRALLPALVAEAARQVAPRRQGQQLLGGGGGADLQGLLDGVGAGAHRAATSVAPAGGGSCSWATATPDSPYLEPTQSGKAGAPYIRCLRVSHAVSPLSGSCTRNFCSSPVPCTAMASASCARVLSGVRTWIGVG